jgi:hypothetical protein
MALFNIVKRSEVPTAKFDYEVLIQHIKSNLTLLNHLGKNYIQNDNKRKVSNENK